VIVKTDPEVVKEIAREARTILDNRAFLQAVIDLRKQWFGEMMDAKTDGPKVLELVAMLRALEAIPSRLASMTHDAQMAPRGNDARRL
jgi:hypothetical protein